MGDDSLFNKYGREFQKGTVLFREGESGEHMYVIQSGQVAISKRVRDVEKVLATLGPGEFFGEMSIISNKPRTATATVTDTARCLLIDDKTFEAMVCGNAEVAVRMIKKLAERLQECDAQIENLLLRDASSRVIHYLAHAANTRGIQTPNGIKVEIVIASMPAMLGIDEQQLRGVIGKLGNARLITIEEDGLVVTDLAKLRGLLDF